MWFIGCGSIGHHSLHDCAVNTIPSQGSTTNRNERDDRGSERRPYHNHRRPSNYAIDDRILDERQSAAHLDG